MASHFLAASGLDRQIGFVLRQAQAAVWHDLVRTLEPFGLKPQGYATLLLIDASPGCKQQDVADALDIARPNMVALIDRLIDADLVRREMNVSDRRCYALSLTAAGTRQLALSRRAHDAHERRVAGLLVGDRDAVIAACGRLATLAARS